LQVLDSLGNTVSTFGIEIASGQPALSIASDGAGGSLITLGDELPCFARGTGLLTPHGYRAVETLKPGDPLTTAKGIRRPVRWIGRRTLDLGPGTARFARPVLIMPGAFRPGQPARMLRLSPLAGTAGGRGGTNGAAGNPPDGTMAHGRVQLCRTRSGYNPALRHRLPGGY
jgi:Hint domain